MKVQQWLDDDQAVPENEYEAITCQACTKLHFLNRKTGKLLGQHEERGRFSRAVELLVRPN